MAGNNISIRLEGVPQENGHVKLTVLIKQLEALRDALVNTERTLTGSDTPTVYYRVVGLSHQSPATITLEPVAIKKKSIPSKKQKDYRGAVNRRLFRNLNAIRKNKMPADTDLAVLESYKELSAPLGKELLKIDILNGRSSVSIDNNFTNGINNAVGEDKVMTGSITGVLDILNLHNTNKFTLHPIVGASRITGEFPNSLKEEVKNSIEKYVRVYGDLYYKTKHPYPYKIDAQKIEIVTIRDPKELTARLRGSVTNVPMDIPSDEFIHSQRSANW